MGFKKQPLFRHLEAISNASESFQILRMAWVVFDLFAQTPDVDIDGTRCDERCFLPDGIEQLIACQYPTAMCGQIFEQAKFADGGENVSSPHLHSHRRNINLKIAESQD